MSVFLAALDITIVSTALPTIVWHFHSTTGYVWVPSAFLLGNGSSVPTWGKLSDIWGRKTLLLLAVAVFFLGSALCGSAISVAMLITGRAVQGIGAGGLLTLVNIVIGDLFSQRERGLYYGIIGMVWATAAAIGPAVGGALTDKVSWRWCFYINLPISGSAFIIILLTLNLQTPKTPILAGLKAVDWMGSLTITGATIMFLLGLQFGGVFHPWSSPTVLCLIIFGVVTGIIFVIVESRARYPIMPLYIFTKSSNLGILFVNFSHSTYFLQGAYFLPVYFQSVLAARPLLSGVWTLPWALSVSLSSAATGIYIKKTGRYFDCILFGLLLSVLGYGLLCNLPDRRLWPKVIIYQIISGIGTGPNFQAPMIALQSSVAAQDNATVTATYAFIRNLACAIGIVIGSTILSNEMTNHQSALVTSLGPDAAARFSGNKAQASILLIDSLHTDKQRTVVRHAYYDSLQSVWIEIVCLAAVGLVAAAFVERTRRLSNTHEEVRTGLEAEQERRRIARGSKEKGLGKGEDTA